MVINKKEYMKRKDACPYGPHGHINCDDGCVFHEIKENAEDMDATCKCTCEDLAGIIQCGDVCEYRKERTIKVPNDKGYFQTGSESGDQ